MRKFPGRRNKAEIYKKNLKIIIIISTDHDFNVQDDTRYFVLFMFL